MKLGNCEFAYEKVNCSQSQAMHNAQARLADFNRALYS